MVESTSLTSLIVSILRRGMLHGAILVVVDF